MSKLAVEHVWESVRKELRKLRGENQFRGIEDHLIHQKQIRLACENRAGQLNSTIVVIHLTAGFEDLWAEEVPNGRRWMVTEFGGNWEQWLHALVDRCRGAAYLHTKSNNAEYRKFAITMSADTNANNE